MKHQKHDPWQKKLIKCTTTKWKRSCFNRHFLKGKHKLGQKDKATDWGKIFANYISDKGFVSNIYKEHLQLNYKLTTQLKNGQRSESTNSTWKDAQHR